MTKFSFFAMFADASLLVQIVLVLLIIFSILCWTIIIKKAQMFKYERQNLAEFENSFYRSSNVNDFISILNQREQNLSIAEKIFHSGFAEFERLRSLNDEVPEATIKGANRQMHLALNRELDELSDFIPFLGTVGSVSPYIGLLGTVWGIMNSFLGLSAVKQATLQAVAPGIAEALIATAIGLFAAIPAVIAYNRFNLTVVKFEQSYLNIIDESTAIMQRIAFARKV